MHTSEQGTSATFSVGHLVSSGEAAGSVGIGPVTCNHWESPESAERHRSKAISAHRSRGSTEEKNMAVGADLNKYIEDLNRAREKSF